MAYSQSRGGQQGEQQQRMQGQGGRHGQRGGSGMRQEQNRGMYQDQRYDDLQGSGRRGSQWDTGSEGWDDFDGQSYRENQDYQGGREHREQRGEQRYGGNSQSRGYSGGRMSGGMSGSGRGYGQGDGSQGYGQSHGGQDFGGQGFGGQGFENRGFGQEGFGGRSMSSSRSDYPTMGEGQYNRANQGWGDEQGRYGSQGFQSGQGEYGRQERGGNGNGSSGMSSRESGRFSGVGPSGFKRSDERLKEVVCERLSEDPWIDASNIDIAVKNGEITLSGTVPDRQTKYRAEEVVESVLGTGEVTNNIRIQKSTDRSSSGSTQRGRGTSGDESDEQEGKRTKQ